MIKSKTHNQNTKNKQVKRLKFFDKKVLVPSECTSSVTPDDGIFTENLSLLTCLLLVFRFYHYLCAILFGAQLHFFVFLYIFDSFEKDMFPVFFCLENGYTL